MVSSSWKACMVWIWNKINEKDAFDYYQAPYTVNMNERLLNMWAANNVTV